MEKITRRVKDLARCYGASGVGIVTTDMLKGAPLSADLTYVLPTAKSAVSFAVSLDQNCIVPWFKKENQEAHFRNNIHANVMASGISLEIANYLEQKGYPSIPLTSNTAYRSDTENGRYDEKPPISHRYLAVRSGVGFFGLEDGKDCGWWMDLQLNVIPKVTIVFANVYCDNMKAFPLC